MLRRSATAFVVLLLAGAVATGVALAARSEARIGGTVTVKANGLEAGSYSLRLVADDRPPGQSAFCVARIAGPRRTSAGRVTLRGDIPKRLTCWENNSERLGRVRVTPGDYHLIVAVPDGPTGSDPDYSFLRRALRIRRAR